MINLYDLRFHERLLASEFAALQSIITLGNEFDFNWNNVVLAPKKI